MITKEQVKGSLEANWRLHQAKVYLVLWGILTAVMFFISFCYAAAKGMPDAALWASGILALVYAAVFLPFSGVSYCKYLRIINRWEKYESYTVTLDRPGTSYFYNRSVYYTVRFHTESGKEVTADTMPLWSGAAFALYQLEDYNNKKIRILYDPEEEKIVVLGPAK